MTVYVVARDVDGKEIDRVRFRGPFARLRAEHWIGKQLAPITIRGVPLWTYGVES